MRFLFVNLENKKIKNITNKILTPLTNQRGIKLPRIRIHITKISLLKSQIIKNFLLHF